MRELMINEIKAYYWNSWDCRDKKIEHWASEADYVAWLNSLDDEHLLSEYNSSSEIINNMD